MADPWVFTVSDGSEVTLPGDIPEEEIPGRMEDFTKEYGLTMEVKYKPTVKLGPIEVGGELARFGTETAADLLLSGGGAALGAAGGVPAAPVTAGVVNPVTGAIAGGAAGAVAASQASEDITKWMGIRPSDDNAMANAGISVAADALLPPLARRLKKTAKWVARGGRGADEVGERLARQRALGIKPTTASVTQGPMQQQAWDLASQSVWAQGPVRRNAAETAAGLRKTIEDNVMLEVPGGGSRKPLTARGGEIVRESPTLYDRQIRSAEIRPMYEKVYSKVPEGTTATTPNMRKYLDDTVSDEGMQRVLNAPGMEAIKKDLEDLFTHTKSILAWDEAGNAMTRDVNIDKEVPLDMLRRMKRRISKQAYGSFDPQLDPFKGQLQDLERAITADIENAVGRIANRTGDPQMLTDLQAANARFGQHMEDMAGLTALARKTTSPQGWKGFKQLVGDQDTAGVNRIKQAIIEDAKGDVGPWEEVRNLYIRDMGFSPDMNTFEPGKFINNYGKMEDPMKDAIFGKGTDLRKSLDEFRSVIGENPIFLKTEREISPLSMLSQARQAGRGILNPAILLGTGAGVGTGSVGTGATVAGLTVALEAIPAQSAARLMQAPWFLDWMTEATKLKPGGFAPFMAKAPAFFIENAMSQEDVEAAADFTEALSAIGEPEQQDNQGGVLAPSFDGEGLWR